VQLNYIYANTSEVSLLAALCCTDSRLVTTENYTKLAHLYLKGFLLESMTVFHTAVPARTQTKKMNSLDISEYYEHFAGGFTSYLLLTTTCLVKGGRPVLEGIPGRSSYTSCCQGSLVPSTL